MTRILLLLFMALPAAVVADGANCPPLSGMHREQVRVASVRDGDTLALSDGRKVRLLGVNAPEMQGEQGAPEPFARKAKEAVKAWLPSGRVEIVYDRERRDRYGRLLAHVYDGKGRNLESMLLVQGLAWHVAVPPNLALADCLATVESGASKAGEGVWSLSPVSSRDLDRGGFQRVKGRVASVVLGKAWWVNLEGELAAVIYPEHQHRFDRQHVARLEGQVIEVQGWVYPSRSRKYQPWRMKLETPWAME